jgi:hypothetical protein
MKEIKREREKEKKKREGKEIGRIEIVSNSAEW